MLIGSHLLVLIVCVCVRVGGERRVSSWYTCVVLAGGEMMVLLDLLCVDKHVWNTRHP